MMVTVQELQHGTVAYHLWDGDPERAIDAAADYLGAIYDNDRQAWVYTDGPTGITCAVSRDGMIEAGACVILSLVDWYSLWCTVHGEPV